MSLIENPGTTFASWRMATCLRQDFGRQAGQVNASKDYDTY